MPNRRSSQHFSLRMFRSLRLSNSNIPPHSPHLSLDSPGIIKCRWFRQIKFRISYRGSLGSGVMLWQGNLPFRWEPSPMTSTIEFTQVWEAIKILWVATKESTKSTQPWLSTKTKRCRKQWVGTSRLYRKANRIFKAWARWRPIKIISQKVAPSLRWQTPKIMWLSTSMLAPNHPLLISSINSRRSYPNWMKKWKLRNQHLIDQISKKLRK